MSIVAIILVAGKSTRFDANVSKQVFLLNNKPVFSYALNAFYNCKKIDEICLVSDKEHFDDLESYIKTSKMHNVHLVLGGDSRQQSVEHGLEVFKSLSDTDYVLVHDGARPLISEEIILSTIEAVEKYDAVTTYLPMEDTVVVSDEGNSIIEFIDRNKIMRIQTPQAFKLGLIREAHKYARTLHATDDCSLVMEIPHQVKLIPGSKKLTKLTTIDDAKYLESLLK